MKNKNVLIIAVLIVFIVAIAAICIYYLSANDNEPGSKPNNYFEPSTPNTNEQNDISIPTSGNDTVVSTKSQTKLRYINNYTTDFFTAEKNLLIMFGSWCSHCQTEIIEIEKILKYYKNVKDVKVIVIAHEYKDTVSDLISLVEKDVDFGNTEVLVDLKRIIRKNVDSEANSVPVSYVVDRNGNMIKKHDSEITLEAAKDLLK